MVASIGKSASPAQGVSYFERDDYYAKDDPAHREASAWAGKGVDALGLSGPVDPDALRAVLEGRVSEGSADGAASGYAKHAVGGCVRDLHEHSYTAWSGGCGWIRRLSGLPTFPRRCPPASIVRNRIDKRARPC